MKMTEDEIIRDYLEAKDKKKQVEILADMNLCTKKEMAQYLADHGMVVDKRLLAGKPGKKVDVSEPDLKEAQRIKFAKILESVDAREPLPSRKPLPDQTAKADAGKLQLTLVPPQHHPGGCRCEGLRKRKVSGRRAGKLETGRKRAVP